MKFLDDRNNFPVHSKNKNVETKSRQTETTGFSTKKNHNETQVTRRIESSNSEDGQNLLRMGN